MHKKLHLGKNVLFARGVKLIIKLSFARSITSINMENKKLQEIASQVRRDIVRMVSAVNSGHPGGSLGCADFLTVLYFDVMKHDPSNFTMEGTNEDVFYLSNGHIPFCLEQGR